MAPRKRRAIVLRAPKKKDPENIKCMRPKQDSPQCVHGPTILFERLKGETEASRRFYKCSAFSNELACNFFHWEDEDFNEVRKQRWLQYAKDCRIPNSHEECTMKYDEVKSLIIYQRGYCNDCKWLVNLENEEEHMNCKVVTPLSDFQLKHPSVLLPPKGNRIDSQHFFVRRSVEVMTELFAELGCEKVLCLAVPRIHEYICTDKDSKLNSFLMDIDDRHMIFYPQNKFAHYNLHTHHFFGGEEAKKNYINFLTTTKKLFVICDPPYSGRIQLVVYTLESIQADWRKANGWDDTHKLPVMITYPYHCEEILKKHLPDFNMLDYVVDIQHSKALKKSLVSNIRPYVNMAPNLFPLPAEDGYKNCAICDRWVMENNEHCYKCNSCMAKNGRVYKHCDGCQTCVKPSFIHCQYCKTCKPRLHQCQGGVYKHCDICKNVQPKWVHCKKCRQCQPVSHPCLKALTIVCFRCGRAGHIMSECPEKNLSASQIKKNKKKKQKTENYHSIDAEVERNKQMALSIIV